MGAATYTRNARPNHDAHEAQAAACKRLAAELGYDAVTEFHDEGRERPVLEQPLAAVREGPVSALLVADFFRLSRSAKEFANTMTTLDEASVPLYVEGHGRVSLPVTPALGMMLAIAGMKARARKLSSLRNPRRPPPFLLPLTHLKATPDLEQRHPALIQLHRLRRVFFGKSPHMWRNRRQP